MEKKALLIVELALCLLQVNARGLPGSRKWLVMVLLTQVVIEAIIGLYNLFHYV